MDYSLLIGIHNLQCRNGDNVQRNTLQVFSPPDVHIPLQLNFGGHSQYHPLQTQTQVQQPQQLQQQQQQQGSTNGLALPSAPHPYHSVSGPVLPGLGPMTAVPTIQPFSYNSQATAATKPAPPPSSQTSTISLQGPAQSGTGAAAPSAGPSMSPAQVPATPAPLTLEQQHITTVEGIVPTLQNIVAMVNLCTGEPTLVESSYSHDGAAAHRALHGAPEHL